MFDANHIRIVPLVLYISSSTTAILFFIKLFQMDLDAKNMSFLYLFDVIHVSPYEDRGTTPPTSVAKMIDIWLPCCPDCFHLCSDSHRILQLGSV